MFVGIVNLPVSRVHLVMMVAGHDEVCEDEVGGIEGKEALGGLRAQVVEI